MWRRDSVFWGAGGEGNRGVLAGGIADAILISATRSVCMFSTTKDAALFTSGKLVKGMPDYSSGYDLTNATF